jgi:hypothetical protein
MKPIGTILFLLLFTPGLEAKKSVVVCYDISKSMKKRGDESMKRINQCLTELLFSGISAISPDDILLQRETTLFGKEKPLLEIGDRLSLIMFGGLPIPDPVMDIVWDGSPSQRKRFLRHLPKSILQMEEEWTYLELLYWRVAKIFHNHPELSPKIRVLVSDKCESRQPLNRKDQARILWYKDRWREVCLLEVMIGGIHIEVSEIVPPFTGIRVLKPAPYKLYFAKRPIPLYVEVVEEGKVAEGEWEVVAEITSEKGSSQLFLTEGDGVYYGTFSEGAKGPIRVWFEARCGDKVLKSDELKISLTEKKNLSLWIPVSILALFILFLRYQLMPLRFWIEREGYPMRRVELKRTGDMLFLGERENEPYIDIGLPDHFLVRETKKKVTIWHKKEKVGRQLAWNRWFVDPEREGIALRISKKRLKRKRGDHLIKREDVADEMFYKV